MAPSTTAIAVNFASQYYSLLATKPGDLAALYVATSELQRDDKRYKGAEIAQYYNEQPANAFRVVITDVTEDSAKRSSTGGAVAFIVSASYVYGNGQPSQQFRQSIELVPQGTVSAHSKTPAFSIAADSLRTITSSPIASAFGGGVFGKKAPVKAPVSQPTAPLVAQPAPAYSAQHTHTKAGPKSPANSASTGAVSPPPPMISEAWSADTPPAFAAKPQLAVPPMPMADASPQQQQQQPQTPKKDAAHAAPATRQPAAQREKKPVPPSPAKETASAAPAAQPSKKPEAERPAAVPKEPAATSAAKEVSKPALEAQPPQKAAPAKDATPAATAPVAAAATKEEKPKEAASVPKAAPEEATKPTPAPAEATKPAETTAEAAKAPAAPLTFADRVRGKQAAAAQAASKPEKEAGAATATPAAAPVTAEPKPDAKPPVESTKPAEKTPEPAAAKTAEKKPAAAAKAAEQPAAVPEDKPAEVPAKPTKAAEPAAKEAPKDETEHSAAASTTDAEDADKSADKPKGQPVNAWARGPLSFNGAAPTAAVKPPATTSTAGSGPVVLPSRPKPADAAEAKEKAAAAAAAAEKPVARTDTAKRPVATAAPAASRPVDRQGGLAAAVSHYHIFVRGLPEGTTEEQLSKVLVPHVPLRPGIKIDSKVVRETVRPTNEQVDRVRTFAFVCLDIEDLSEVPSHVARLKHLRLMLGDGHLHFDEVHEKPVFSQNPPPVRSATTAGQPAAAATAAKPAAKAAPAKK
jgi:hypothetical protein